MSPSPGEEATALDDLAELSSQPGAIILVTPKPKPLTGPLLIVR